MNGRPRAPSDWRFWAVVIIGLLVLGFISPPAKADDATLTWTPPLEQVANCTNQPIEGLTGYRIYQLIEDIADPAIVEFTVPNLPSGDYTFAATAYNADGEESMLSGQAVKTSTGLAVNDPRVYVVTKIANGFLLVVAGSIEVGTMCNESTEVNGRFAVPVDLVQWSGTVEDVMAVAECH